MSSLHTSRGFIGLDLFRPPASLGPQHLTQADNLLVDGGDLVTRPGFKGLFTTPLGAPLYSLTPFLDTDGTTKLVFVSGGRLYKWAKGATAPVEIPVPGVSGTISSAASRITRLGHDGYLIDSVLPLVRFDLTGGKVAPTLNAPAPAPVAALTSTVLDSLLSGSWTPDTLTGAGQSNRLVNPGFTLAYAAPDGLGNLPTGWTGVGSTPDDNGSPPAGYSGHWLNQDTPGTGIILTTALANDPVAGDAARYATQFYAAVDAVQLDTTGGSSLIVTVLGYADAGGTSLAGQVQREFSLPYNGGQAVTLGGVFSFASFTTPILSYRVQFLAGENNKLGTGSAVYIKNWVCFPFASALTATVSGSQLDVKQPAALTYTGGTLTTSLPGQVGGGTGAGGQHLTRDFGSAQDWHSFDHVVLSLGKALGITRNGTVPPQPGPVLRLAFRQAGSATRYYSNPLTISDDGAYASVDISTVSSAVRSAFRYLEIVLGGDFTVPASSGDDLVLLGPLTGAGNLGTGFAYYYVYTEVDANGTTLLTNIIQSNPSALSNTLTATALQAEAAITLPTTPTNAAATLFYLWRFGGVFSKPDGDGRARLITKRKFTDTVAYGQDPGQAGSTGNVPNPYIAYSAGLLTDNTPDLFLLGAETLVEGRDAPPVGASSLCAWQARLFLGKAGTVYASWAVTLDSQDALYFTSANLPDDPLAAIKGDTFSVGQDDGDSVQALLPIATNAYFSKGFLGILKQHSVWLLSGTDPENFALQSYLLGSGRGCVAPRGATLVEGQIWYTRSDGISSFNGDTPSNQSQPVEALLRPPDGSVQQLPAAYAGAALVYHGRRVWCFVSVPGATLNTSALVYDTRQGGWTRMLTPFGVTGAASASSQTDNDDFYLAGADGQLYQVTGLTDQATPGAAGAAIPFAAKTGGKGQEGGDIGFWQMNTAVKAYFEVQAPSAFTGTLTVDTEAGNQWTQGYTFSGLRGPWVRVPPGVKGQYHVLGLSGSVTARTRIRSLALESAETGVQQ